MNEAMGLASMNPMVGIGGRGNIITNSLSHDKDISDGWGSYSVSKTLDKDDVSLSVDGKGKLIKNTVATALGEDYITGFYSLNPKADEIFNSLLEETNLDYEDRPVHNRNYIYEVFTGHKLYTPDQPKYDSLLEEIELEKMSKAVSAVGKSDESSFENFKKSQREKDGEYIPDSKSPFNSLENHIPILNKKDRKLAEELLKKLGNKDILIFEDYLGFYGYNDKTGKRTDSVTDMKNIYFEDII
jgi:hypothetical protein